MRRLSAIGEHRVRRQSGNSEPQRQSEMGSHAKYWLPILSTIAINYKTET